MSYWSNRQQKAMLALEKSEDAIKKRISKYLLKESARLDRLISSYFTKYSVNDVVDYKLLMLSLSDADKELLYQDWSAFTQQYPQYAYLAPVRESIYKLNRLDGLQSSIRLMQLEFGAFENEQLKAHLEHIGADAYENALQTLGHEYNPEIIKQFVNTMWTGDYDFSSTIWNNTEKLSKYLCTDVAQGFARGDSYAKLSKQVTERMEKVSRRDAYRLIYTEGTFVYNKATASVVSQDFDEYRISSINDNKTCDICKGMRGKTFRFEDIDTGVNFPPFHAWCRCSFEIVLPEDRDKWLQDYVKNNGGNTNHANTILNRM